MTIQPFFPYLVTGAAILTDNIFVTYGGQTGTSTVAQRNSAYQIAEQFAIEEIGTFLVPTTLTGTFAWPSYPERWQLPHTHVRSVSSLTTIHDAGCDCADDAVELSGCAWIVDYQAGTLDLRECGELVSGGGCQCNCRAEGDPIQFRIIYEAGIQAGLVAANAPSLQGLVIAADLALEQIIDPSGAEAGPGDASIKSFSDTGYSETRQFLMMTAFGGSPRANYAARMLKPLKFKRALKL